MSGARRAGVLAAALLGGMVPDAMPMRRDEMRARGIGCPPGTRG
jgi:hypothetical protein